jgi:lysophospholipase
MIGMKLDLQNLFKARVPAFSKPVEPRKAELVAVPENPVPADGKVGFITSSNGVSLRYALWRGTSMHRFGTVCILPGRGEFIEKYSETISDLRRRGFTVATFDWRGQGGSDRELANSRKGHVADFKEYDADLQSFVKKVLLPDCPAPFFALAHSMGANILLRNTAYESCQFERVVMVSPMLKLKQFPVSEGLVRFFVEVMSIAGFSDAYVPGGSDLATEQEDFEGNRLTSDRVRYERFQKVLEAAPELGTGSPTNGWLYAAFRSMNELSMASFPGCIKVPVLMFSAANDEIVSSEAIQKFAAEARMCRLTGIPGARHEIMQERQAFREEFWAAFDKFIPGTKEWEIL